MKEYKHHIKDEMTSNISKDTISFCGKYIDGEWFFMNVDHVIMCLQTKDRLLPCQNCKEKIINLLK